MLRFEELVPQYKLFVCNFVIKNLTKETRKDNRNLPGDKCVIGDTDKFAIFYEHCPLCAWKKNKNILSQFPWD